MTVKIKKNIIIFILAAFTCLFASCSHQNNNDTLLLSGDVDEWVKIDEIWNDIEKLSFEYDGSNHKGVSLESLISIGGTVSNDYNIFLKSNDGYMVRLASSSIANTYISYSKELGYHFLSEKYPVNSKVKFIDEIIIRRNYDNSDIADVGINIVSYEKQIHKSIGELLSDGYEVMPCFDETTSKNGVSIDVLSQKKVVKLSSLWDNEINSILVMDNEGHHEYLYASDGYFEIGYNQINFFIDEKSDYFTNVEGIIVNPPSVSVMDTFFDCNYYIQNDEDVLILFIDGFSYQQYKYILNTYPQMFLSQLQDVNMATSVYKPVTNAGFAAMITGKPPVKNGIFNRDYRELLCPTLFDFADDENAASLLIEGSIKILNTDCEIILNIDENIDGYTDDEIFESALNNIDHPYNVMLVHFHSVDDAGHSNGPFGSETIDRIKAIDKYIYELSSNWNGKVIITADHGMHQTNSGGSHGEFRYEDMYIPYVVIEGGIYEK